MVSSTDGSPTSTCWKRRSSAGSFSMCSRYSSSVVAPTIRSSPRASIGLIMLPASIAPSPVAPAPTMVCSSSMNVMTWPSRVLDLLEHGLEPLLELAAVLRAGDHRAEVERDDALVAQRLGHVAGDDALGQALDDRGLADAGLADQHRVVLGAPGQHLHHAADLGVAADHRVELALAGARGQVDAVLLQRLVGALRVGAGDPRRAADPAANASRSALRGGAVRLQQLGDRRRRSGPGRPAGARWRRTRRRGGVGTDGGEQRRGDAVALGEQRAEQVRRADVGVAGQRGGLHGGRDGLLGLGGGVERVHSRVLLRTYRAAARTGPAITRVNAERLEPVPLRLVPRAVR